MKVKALVVDDSRATRKMIGRILNKLGFEVWEAGHALEALEQLKKLGPSDIALIDYNMPGMNGVDLIKVLKKNNSYGHIPMVMVSSESDVNVVQSSLDAGASEYIMKPFSAESLREKLVMVGAIDG